MPAGTGTVINKSGIKQYQQATRDRSKVWLPCLTLLHTSLERLCEHSLRAWSAED